MLLPSAERDISHDTALPTARGKEHAAESNTALHRQVLPSHSCDTVPSDTAAPDDKTPIAASTRAGTQHDHIPSATPGAVPVPAGADLQSNADAELHHAPVPSDSQHQTEAVSTETVLLHNALPTDTELQHSVIPDSDVFEDKDTPTNDESRLEAAPVDTVSHQKATLGDTVLLDKAEPNDTVLKHDAADDNDDIPLQPEIEDPEGNKELDDIKEHEVETGIVTATYDKHKVDSEMSGVEPSEVSTQETGTNTRNIDISETQTCLELSAGDSQGTADDPVLESVNCRSPESPDVCQETCESLCDQETPHSLKDTDPANTVSESDGLSDAYNSQEVTNPDSQSSSQEIIGKCSAAVTGDCSTVPVFVF